MRAVAELNPPVIRSIITDDEFGGFRITIPGPEGGKCAFGCGLAFWAAVVALTLLYIVSDPRDNLTGGSIFLGVLLLIGLVFGLIAAHGWTFREVLMIEGKSLVLRRESAGYSRDLTFDLAGVKNLRPAPVVYVAGQPYAPRL